MRLDQLGVQLYTLRALMASDAEAVLAQVAEIGYRNVETAGDGAGDPAALRHLLDERGLRAPAGHYRLEVLRGDALPRTLAAARRLGHRYVVVPGLDEAERTSLDGYRRVSEELNEVAAAVAKAGMRLAYHNHDVEFEPMGGRLPYDVLLAETDPELVDMELDLYWIVECGHDPHAYLQACPGRFPLWHLKDRTGDGAMADVGAGTLDFASLLAHAERAGLQYAFVEHDHPAEPLESVQASFAHLAKLTGMRSLQSGSPAGA